jgi:hypothetical protein
LESITILRLSFFVFKADVELLTWGSESDDEVDGISHFGKLALSGPRSFVLALYFFCFA